MSHSPISRRTLFGAATAALAAEAGARVLGGPLFGGSTLGLRMRRAVLDGDGRAFADTFTPTSTPIFVFTVHAKWESAGWLNRPNPAAVGIVGNANADVSKAFPGFGLTKMFGDYVAPLAGKVGFGIVPVTTTSGNHVYDGLRNTMSSTGCLPAAAGEALSSLMALHFSSVGTADGATACFAKGGAQLITYDSMNSAVSSMMNALTPLTNLPASAQPLLQQLNDRVTKDQRFRQGLEDLANRLSSARDPLNAALALANAAPPKGMTTFDQMVPADLQAQNPLVPQVDAAAALIKLGLLQACTISIANSDPNAGGDHAARGGSNVAFGARSPNEVKSCVAQAIARIYSQFPQAYVSITSDGGRQAAGGDSENFEAFLFGPPDKVANVFVNADQRKDSSTFGTNPPPAALSDGSSMPPTQANLMATVAKAVGFPLGDTPYIPALLRG
jgi:hypothetical protein